MQTRQGPPRGEDGGDENAHQPDLIEYRREWLLLTGDGHFSCCSRFYRIVCCTTRTVTLQELYGMWREMARKLAVVQNQACGLFFVFQCGRDSFFLLRLMYLQNSFPARTTLQSQGGLVGDSPSGRAQSPPLTTSTRVTLIFCGDMEKNWRYPRYSLNFHRRYGEAFEISKVIGLPGMFRYPKLISALVSRVEHATGL